MEGRFKMMRIATPLAPELRPKLHELIQIYVESTRIAAAALTRYDTDGAADLMAIEQNGNATAALHAIRELYGLETPAAPTQINPAMARGFDIK